MHDRSSDLTGALNGPDLILAWSEAPWDSAVFGFPVLQITEIEARSESSERVFQNFEAARKRVQAGLVSCRLPADRLHESMLLESRGFRFIEMLYQPQLDDLAANLPRTEPGLTVQLATPDQLEPIQEIAGSAFRNERFHVDPRLDSMLGDQRYRNWVKSSLTHEKQCLYAIHAAEEIVAFFVTEMMPDGSCYWHLNAVAPEAQGKGFGKRAWALMIHQAHELGAHSIRTSIVARNHRVMNLYARLGFRFTRPQMTFHWVRDTQ